MSKDGCSHFFDKSVIVVALSGPKEMYCGALGPYDSESDAQKVADEMNQETGTSGMVYRVSFPEYHPVPK